MIFVLLLAGWLLMIVLVCALCAAARRGEMEHPRLIGQALERQLWTAAEPEIAACSRARRPIRAESESAKPLFHADNAAA
jgi:hypothetical protein